MDNPTSQCTQFLTTASPAAFALAADLAAAPLNLTTCRDHQAKGGMS